jgi:hypothetical protein
MGKMIAEWKGLIADFLKRHFPILYDKIQGKPRLAKEAKEICLILLVIFLFLLIFLWDRQQALELYVKIVAGIVVLWGAYTAWRRLEVLQSGQITERYTRAIDQLGSTHSGGRKNLEVRLGGIYALERIAFDSPQYIPTVMEVLTAYARENSAFTEVVDPSQSYSFVPHDIQAIIKVVSRRRLYKDTERYGHIDFTQTNLPNVVFVRSEAWTGKDAGVNLDTAKFIKANLEGAKLEYASLWYADFRGANLKETCINGADLRFANLQDSINLTKTQIEGAIINSKTILPSYLLDDRKWYEKQIESSESLIED